MTDLWYSGDRNDVIDYLDNHGWATSATSPTDLLAAHGLPEQIDGDEDKAALSGFCYVAATRV